MTLVALARAAVSAPEEMTPKACQVSSTLYNVVLQLPGITVLQRRAHGDNGASYLPIGVDAAVGNSALNFRFRNDYPFPIRIDASAQDGALTIAIYKAL